MQSNLLQRPQMQDKELQRAADTKDFLCRLKWQQHWLSINNFHPRIARILSSFHDTACVPYYIQNERPQYTKLKGGAKGVGTGHKVWVSPAQLSQVQKSKGRKQGTLKGSDIKTGPVLYRYMNGKINVLPYVHNSYITQFAFSRCLNLNAKAKRYSTRHLAVTPKDKTSEFDPVY